MSDAQLMVKRSNFNKIKMTLQTKLVLYFSLLASLTVIIITGLTYVQAVKIIESSPAISHAEALQLAGNLGIKLAIMGIIVWIALILISYLLAWQITHPLRELLNIASLIVAGDLSVTAPHVSTDELGILSQTIKNDRNDPRDPVGA
jgi:methyl-accepting chemotaxis protein